MLETPINIEAYLCVGLIAVAVLVIAWGIRALLERRLFPPQRQREVSWNGWQLIVLVLFVQLVWPAVISLAAQQSGLLTYLSGPESGWPNTEGNPEPASDKALRQARESVWLYAAMFPIQIATIIGLLVAASQARLADMGLTTREFGHNVLLGILGW